MKTTIVVSLTVLLLAPLCGCGVARSTSAIVQAQKRYEAAKKAQADERAPYEYTLGVEYLKKAREEASYSDYQMAEQLANRAKAHLADAERRADAINLEGDLPE